MFNESGLKLEDFTVKEGIMIHVVRVIMTRQCMIQKVLKPLEMEDDQQLQSS